MQQKEINFQKKRELGLIISSSFDFLKQEIKPITRLIFIYVLPFVVLYAIAQVYFQQNVLSKVDLSDQEALTNNIGPFYKNLLMYMFFGLFVQSLLAGTFYSYIEAYIKHGKGNFELADISTNFFSNGLLAIGANLVYVIIGFFGLMAFVLPGIYFANTFSLLLFIFIFEKKGLSNALSKSWKLVNSQWWNTLIINLLGVAIIWGVSMIMSIPNIFFNTNGNLLTGGETNISEYPGWYWLVSGASIIVGTIAMVIPFTFQAFQYFNLEERTKPRRKISSEDLK